MATKTLARIVILYAFTIVQVAECFCQADSCRAIGLVYTSDLGDGVGQFPIPLRFKFEKDSIRIQNPDGTPEGIFGDMVFFIRDAACTWDSTDTTGSLRYGVLLKDGETEKLGELTVEVVKGKGKVRLTYGQSEPRVFTIRRTAISTVAPRRWDVRKPVNFASNN